MSAGVQVRDSGGLDQVVEVEMQKGTLIQEAIKKWNHWDLGGSGMWYEQRGGAEGGFQVSGLPCGMAGWRKVPIP